MGNFVLFFNIWIIWSHSYLRDSIWKIKIMFLSSFQRKNRTSSTLNIFSMIRNSSKFSYFYLYNDLLKKKGSSWKQIYGVFGNLGQLVSFKNICRGVLFLFQLQVLNNALPEVFLTVLSEAYCPKLQAKITRVKRKYHALWISSIASLKKRFTVQNIREYRFSLTRIILYGKIRLRENPYSRIFYTVVSILIRHFC